MRQLRLLVVHPHLNIRGGSERLVKILFEKMPEHVKACLLTSAVDREWFSSATRIFQLSAGHIEASIRNAVRECRPHVVYVAISESYYAYLAKKTDAALATAMFVHFPLEEELTRENIEEYRKAFRFPHLSAKYLDYVDLLLANSERTALATEMLWGRRPRVVYPCIDEIFFKKKARTRREKTVLYVGRFTPLKRQDFLVLAVKSVRESVGDVRLVLAGYPDPRHANYYRKLAEYASRYSWIRILTSVSEEELVDLYDEAWVYAHPRIGEHFGIAPIEAMSRGAFPVVRGPTGLSEVVDESSGAFIVDSDLEFVERIAWLFKLSGEKLEALRSAARKRAASFRPENHVERLIRELEEVATRRARS